MKRTLILSLPAVLLTVLSRQPVSAAPVQSLDGNEWLLATDGPNVGREQKWFERPRPEAVKVKVPWIIQDAFPGYHGVAWYWREFNVPQNPHPGGRYWLRFWAVDYKADVWVNGQSVGSHEGGESPFTFDVTTVVKPGAANLVAVRVLNPTHSPIDGIVLTQTAHRNKALPYSPGSAWNQGGIIDSVELLVAPAVRIVDLFARPDPATGIIRLQTTVHNSAAQPVRGRLEFAVAPAASGETLMAVRLSRELPPGESLVESELRVENPRRWELNDPFLYRGTARVASEQPAADDEHSVRCGFHDFRFQNGWFRLNGRRVFLRSSHTGNCCPVGLEMPVDPDWLRRDLLNSKAMGFNCIRFIAGVAKRYQLDLCDELGLMVYEEAYAGWCLADSPKMAERYNESVLSMVRRDRNHPSVTIWGLLNETPDGPVFRHAASVLPAVRKLDDSRLVLLNSGRWDAASSVAGIALWRNADRTDPCVNRNGTKHVIQALGITWAPGQLAFHPGRDGEYAVVRWTAPTDGAADVAATFTSIAERATTDVHVLHNGQSLLSTFVNLNNCGPKTDFPAKLTVKAGATVDFVVGFGNGNYGADTTALAVRIKTADGKTYDAAADFSCQQNPAGPWSYGMLTPAAKPDAKTFTRFPSGSVAEGLGTLSNPGSTAWEDVLKDHHEYPHVPHSAAVVQRLRTLGEGPQPMFLSEYGIGSAVDLIRAARHYERLGATHAMDAQFYRGLLNRFLDDWKRWKLDEAFDRPEDFFTQSNTRMAGQRLLGLNAIRSNPQIVGHNVTGTVDQGMTGEGCWTTFRELKPGTADALFDGWYPLRWCLFAEPLNVYRGGKVRLEAVLANEDALRPGKYPVRLQVVGPNMRRVFERTLEVTIPEMAEGKTDAARVGDPSYLEQPMAIPVFDEELPIDGPTGRYRLLATFEKGAAAAGGECEFFVTDPADMPAVPGEVVLWGDDAGLADWLKQHGIRVRSFDAAPPAQREVILAAGKPPAPGDATVFRALAERIARGATCVFLSRSVFARGDQPLGWLPLANKGRLESLPAWLYHKDDWCKPHPIFAGLPSGGLMDYAVYREIIPDISFVGQDPPAEAVAGGINAAVGYSSGLTVAAHDLGAGRFILNTLHIREHLGPNPTAERLLRNLLLYAARDTNQPLAELPKDWETRWKAMGY